MGYGVPQQPSEKIFSDFDAVQERTGIKERREGEIPEYLRQYELDRVYTVVNGVRYQLTKYAGPHPTHPGQQPENLLEVGFWPEGVQRVAENSYLTLPQAREWLLPFVRDTLEPALEQLGIIKPR